jgi:alpha-ketoglutarate-dependent taurine dioxygenase
MEGTADLAAELGAAGHVLAAPAGSRSEFLESIARWGEPVSQERIALREGAHAYVARPGPVPLHTDHPDSDLVAWWCEEQDEEDGATLLLDALPVVAALPERTRERLSQVQLACPPLAGGPPSESRPVLRDGEDGIALFCSPWLRAVGADPDHQAALDELRRGLSTEARTRTRRRRMARGDVLIVDNRRVLHGRGAIPPTSRRVLHRVWVRLSAPLRGRAAP